MEWLETVNALGGTEVLGEEVRSGADFVFRLESGLPSRVVAELKRYTGLTDADLQQVIPRRTFATLISAVKLTQEQSDRIARTAGIAAHADRVFGAQDTARGWLRTPNPALGDEAPLRLLRTGSGATLVDAVLTRIEHGIYE